MVADWLFWAWLPATLGLVLIVWYHDRTKRWRALTAVMTVPSVIAVVVAVSWWLRWEDAGMTAAWLFIAVIWLLRGRYGGIPFYGPVNNAPVTILGASHFEIQNGRLLREWRVFDEIAVMAQILRHSGRSGAGA